MAEEAGRSRFPRHFQPLRRAVPISPWADLGIRVLAALALVAFVVAIHYADRNGLVDHSDGHVSFLDVVYFTMISITTTGFGFGRRRISSQMARPSLGSKPSR